MSAAITEIRRKITSNDIDVLRQSLEFARRCLVQENERGQAAETRATVMLGILGVIATFVITGAGALPTTSKPSEAEWLLLTCFVSCLLFLLKALFYAIRTIGVAKKYRVEPGLVLDWQQVSQADALRSEIAGVLWEHDQSIVSNSGRLFLLQRCQRSSYIAILILVLFGFLSIEGLNEWIVAGSCVAIVFSILAGLSVIFLDRVVEGAEGTWRR